MIKNQKRKISRQTKSRGGIAILSLLIILTVTVGGTLAYLFVSSDPVANTFIPAKVTCKVDETFNGEVKSNVYVTNTGNIDAWIRVKLVCYRVNAAGQHIGGYVAQPEITAEGWKYDGVEDGQGHYYYIHPVPAGQNTSNLINSLELRDYNLDFKETTQSVNNETTTIYYTDGDADEGRQVIEVIAEAIQSKPDDAVTEAWGMYVVNGELSPVKGGSIE